jgi:hypothetical protein
MSNKTALEIANEILDASDTVSVDSSDVQARGGDDSATFTMTSFHDGPNVRGARPKRAFGSHFEYTVTIVRKYHAIED